MTDIEVAKRERLCAELDEKINDSRAAGRRNYYAAYLLKLVALTSSIAAGALGLIFKAPAETIGLVALMPGAATILARELMLQPKAHHFYRLSNGLRHIRQRVVFSDDPADTTSNLAKEAGQFRLDMNAEFERTLGFGWSTPSQMEAQQPRPSSPEPSKASI